MWESDELKRSSHGAGVILFFLPEQDPQVLDLVTSKVVELGREEASDSLLGTGAFLLFTSPQLPWEPPPTSLSWRLFQLKLLSEGVQPSLGYCGAK